MDCRNGRKFLLIACEFTSRFAKMLLKPDKSVGEVCEFRFRQKAWVSLLKSAKRLYFQGVCRYYLDSPRGQPLANHRRTISPSSGPQMDGRKES